MIKKEESAQDRYDRSHTQQVKLKLNINTDADIIQQLARVGNKQGYIKSLIRSDISRD